MVARMILSHPPQHVSCNGIYSMNVTKTILSNLATVAEIDPRGLRQTMRSLVYMPKEKM
jgi:hypothetical protein